MHADSGSSFDADPHPEPPVYAREAPASRGLLDDQLAVDLVHADAEDRPAAATAKRLDPALDVVMERLMAAYPACLVFAIGQGNSTFLGATPEQLVSLDKGHVSVTCLAGSAPRGANVEQDEVMGNELLERHKDQREHAYVVQAVRESLSGLCADVTYDHQPGLLKLPSVQHLSTHFSATVSADTHVLDLAQALHPTPAVGGTPRNKAMEAIRTIERADRGWYAAPVGHIGASGDGEFGVAIRSALMQGNKALLYAGAGIVEGSEPDLELAEVELKLNAMRSVLAGDD